MFSIMISFLFQKPIILSEQIEEKVLIEKTLSQKEKKQINISVAKKGSK